MALPFFRKAKDKDKPAAASKPQPAPPTETHSHLGGEFAPAAGGIVVEETLGAPQSAIDEAAIQFAAGQIEQAERTLNKLLDEEPRAWAMLFDLYIAGNREADFEQLAVDYAVRFETSPPIWRPPVGVATTHNGADLQIELPGMLARSAADELARELATAPAGAMIAIDFSRIELVDEAGAETTAHNLERAILNTRKLRLVGAERLIALLADLTRAMQSKKAHWQLLLTLHQLLGQQEAFEDTAVDFAVHFEVSPPSWVEMAPVESVAAMPAGNGSALAGEITPANDFLISDQLDKAPPGELRIDLGDVTRIDYGSVSQLIGVLMEGLGQGKSVTFVGHNTLIHELFRVMGIDQLAQLEPRRGL